MPLTDARSQPKSTPKSTSKSTPTGSSPRGSHEGGERAGTSADKSAAATAPSTSSTTATTADQPSLAVPLHHTLAAHADFRSKPVVAPQVSGNMVWGSSSSGSGASSSSAFGASSTTATASSGIVFKQSQPIRVGGASATQPTAFGGADRAATGWDWVDAPTSKGNAPLEAGGIEHKGAVASGKAPTGSSGVVSSTATGREPAATAPPRSPGTTKRKRGTSDAGLQADADVAAAAPKKASVEDPDAMPISRSPSLLVEHPKTVSQRVSPATTSAMASVHISRKEERVTPTAPPLLFTDKPASSSSDATVVRPSPFAAASTAAAGAPSITASAFGGAGLSRPSPFATAFGTLAASSSLSSEPSAATAFSSFAQSTSATDAHGAPVASAFATVAQSTASSSTFADLLAKSADKSAPKKTGSGGDDAADEEEDGDGSASDGSAANDSDDAPNKAAMPPQDVLTGEEHELTVFKSTATVKMYDAEARAWKQKGVGPLHVNLSLDTDAAEPTVKARVVVRHRGSNALVMNMPLFTDMSIRLMQERTLLVGAIESGKITTYAIQLENGEAAQAAQDHLTMAKSSPDALHFLQMEGKLYELEQRTHLHDADDVVDYAQHPPASSSPTTGATTQEEVSDLSSTGDFDTYAPDEE